MIASLAFPLAEGASQYPGATTVLELVSGRSLYIILPQMIAFIWIALVLRPVAHDRINDIMRCFLSTYCVQLPVTVMSLVLSGLLYYITKAKVHYFFISSILLIVSTIVYPFRSLGQPPGHIYIDLWPVLSFSVVLSYASYFWGRPDLVLAMHMSTYFLMIFTTLCIITGSLAWSGAFHRRDTFDSVYKARKAVVSYGQHMSHSSWIQAHKILTCANLDRAKAYCMYYYRIPAYYGLRPLPLKTVYRNRKNEVDLLCAWLSTQ